MRIPPQHDFPPEAHPTVLHPLSALTSDLPGPWQKVLVQDVTEKHLRVVLIHTSMPVVDLEHCSHLEFEIRQNGGCTLDVIQHRIARMRSHADDALHSVTLMPHQCDASGRPYRSFSLTELLEHTHKQAGLLLQATAQEALSKAFAPKVDLQPDGVPEKLSEVTLEYDGHTFVPMPEGQHLMLELVGKHPATSWLQVVQRSRDAIAEIALVQEHGRSLLRVFCTPHIGGDCTVNIDLKTGETGPAGHFEGKE